MLYRQYHSNSTLRPARLATSVLRTAHIHHDHLNKIYDSLRHQYDAVHMASLSLDHYVLTIAETFNNVAETSKVELERQAILLSGVQAGGPYPQGQGALRISFF